VGESACSTTGAGNQGSSPTASSTSQACATALVPASYPRLSDWTAGVACTTATVPGDPGSSAIDSKVGYLVVGSCITCTTYDEYHLHVDQAGGSLEHTYEEPCGIDLCTTLLRRVSVERAANGAVTLDVYERPSAQSTQCSTTQLIYDTNNPTQPPQ